ncbi:ribosomal protein L21 [Micromonas commoda]|uniref:Ribosomal protein L21 n=1 Tax=Micromonas commoda (strain RCC299 / NOUM17 / CCMP2709) TaxID=296587 RepID=C1DYF9_MICCC|nr:ribosomal protein L21 [Micromonas commoda]ACO61419.1 ribosomal protein L21 [Micromonas commoda]|eukprot:XP_002500161.1 ribosomal protein L21 [Micromonas commoda]
MSTMAMATVSVAAPVRATAGSKAAKPAFMGRAAAGSKASLSDAFCAMSLATPARKQANRGLSICAAATTSVNQVGFVTPPSTGAAAWDAIVEVGGSQQFVTEGRYYECHSLKGVEPGSKIAFERVLATKAGDAPTFGEPYVPGARVEATVLENFKDKKLIVFKYRRKKHYKRKNGHRQPMTRFLVTKVVKP